MINISENHMNGKKSKMLRKLAGVNKTNNQDRKYFGDKSTVKNKKITHSILLDSKGKRLELGRYRTATYVLHSCPRTLYKTLKEAYKSKIGLFAKIKEKAGF